MKAQYCEHLLEDRLQDTTAVVNYCRHARAYLETLMNYFRELMPTQEGNMRARCFSLYRRTRIEYSAMNDVTVHYLSLDLIEDE
ncbi:MAG: hypothetical protein GF418_11635 [Chitinivibrionales bacterium]|nr:hypothetical protein [Chitinivibrionales bacterium]MBD3396267.1 hypothetical protein [Chitinivibrionales bacterium]